MLPVLPPFSLFVAADWNGTEAFNALANLLGIKCKSRFSQLLVHFSSAVPTLKLCPHLRDVGSMLAPCLYGRGFGSERPFFYKMTHFRKRLIAVLTSELQLIT
jgi:hypothetical protein